MTDYTEMWSDLDIDLERHDVLLCALPAIYESTHLEQKSRPKEMSYFDYMVSEIHGLRVKELVDHKANGGKVFGAFCVYVPEEIVIAAGSICVGLCGGSEIYIGSAEAILPPNTCPLIKASLGFLLERICHYFQVADLIVGETTCDGKKKAWEIFEEYATMYVMELPQRKGKHDKELWLSELQAFRDKVEEITGNKVTPDNLAQAITLIHERRNALQRLFDLRKADPAPISGLDALVVLQLSFFDDPLRATNQVNTLCDELESRVKQGVGAAPKGTPRILVAGSPMAIPNWKIHSIIESIGAIIVCEESCTGTRSLTGSTPVDGNGMDAQLKAIADRQFRTNCACFTPNDERVDDILRLCKEYNVDGVIHYALQFCQPFGMEAIKIQKALDKAGIPMLRLETDYSDGDSGQIKTRVEAFLEMIGQ